MSRRRTSGGSNLGKILEDLFSEFWATPTLPSPYEKFRGMGRENAPDFGITRTFWGGVVFEKYSGILFFKFANILRDTKLVPCTCLGRRNFRKMFDKLILKISGTRHPNSCLQIFGGIREWFGLRITFAYVFGNTRFLRKVFEDLFSKFVRPLIPANVRQIVGAQKYFGLGITYLYVFEGRWGGGSNLGFPCRLFYLLIYIESVFFSGVTWFWMGRLSSSVSQCRVLVLGTELGYFSVKCRGRNFNSDGTDSIFYYFLN